MSYTAILDTLRIECPEVPVDAPKYAYNRASTGTFHMLVILHDSNVGTTLFLHYKVRVETARVWTWESIHTVTLRYLYYMDGYL